MAIGKRKVFHTKHRQRRIFWKRIIVGGTSMIVLASVCALVFYGTRLSVFTVNGVVVHGTETVPEGDVRARTDALLAGAYYGLVPHRFRPTLPEQQIIESVEGLARVSSATVHTEGKNVVVTVVEHTPEMLWCASAIATSTCYYVDETGSAYEKSPELVGSALLRFITEGVEPTPGASLLTNETRSLLIDIGAILEERHEFRIARIEYFANGDAILYLTQGGHLLVATTNNLAETYDNLSSVLSTEEYAHLKPGKFEYIDLRFGNKVFVQKDKPIATTTASTTNPVE